MNFSFLRDVTVVSFLAPCLATKGYDVDSLLQGIGLFSVVLRFDLVFWYLLDHSSSFRRSWWFMAPTGCLQYGNRWVWEDSRGFYTAFNWRMDPTCFRLKKIFGAVHVQLRARVRSQNVHRHVLWVAPVAPTSGVHVQQSKGKTRFTSKSVLHPLMEGLTRDDPLAGAPVFHVS